MAAFVGVVVGVAVPALIAVPVGRWMADMLAGAILGDVWGA
ncbi:hypothetical protein DFLDMN_004711 [Cupriavidus sp. H19C3]